jgi:type II secretory pathway pseudopilin PulG
MKKAHGFTLLELIITCLLTMTLLTTAFGFFFKLSAFWQQSTANQQELEELSFAAENIREAVWGGEVLNTSSSTQLDVKDLEDRTVSFYLKNNKVCMYKNATFYLTTDSVPLSDISFQYISAKVPGTVTFATTRGKNYKYFL